MSTTCQRNLQSSPHVFCCPNSFHCSHSAGSAVAVCPLHDFMCPLSLGGGCCPVGLRCAPSVCLENEHKTLAVLTPPTARKQIHAVQEPRARALTGAVQSLPTASTLPSQTDSPATSSLLRAAAPTCISPARDCKYYRYGRWWRAIPIKERSWRAPAASSAKLGGVAMESMGRSERSDYITEWTRIMWLMAVLGAFTGVMVVL